MKHSVIRHCLLCASFLLLFICACVLLVVNTHSVGFIVCWDLSCLSVAVLLFDVWCCSLFLFGVVCCVVVVVCCCCLIVVGLFVCLVVFVVCGFMLL